MNQLTLPAYCRKVFYCPYSSTRNKTFYFHGIFIRKTKQYLNVFFVCDEPDPPVHGQFLAVFQRIWIVAKMTVSCNIKYTFFIKILGCRLYKLYTGLFPVSGKL
jgi:hypothetical protein